MAGGATMVVLALPAGGAMTVVMEELVASEAVMVAMVASRVAQVATVATVVHMAEAGWRSSRLGDGWKRTGTGAGQWTDHILRHSKSQTHRHRTLKRTSVEDHLNTLRVRHGTCSSSSPLLSHRSVCRQSR